jgi:hypothetical protein
MIYCAKNIRWSSSLLYHVCRSELDYIIYQHHASMDSWGLSSLSSLESSELLLIYVFSACSCHILFSKHCSYIFFSSSGPLSLVGTSVELLTTYPSAFSGCHSFLLTFFQCLRFLFYLERKIVKEYENTPYL